MSQPYMEPVLVNNAAARGASMLFNTEYLGHEQDAGGVIVYVHGLLSYQEREIRARHMIGADGARSQVVEELGLQLDGELARAATAYILFRADLSRYVEHRPSVLHWLMTPSAGFGEIGMGLLRAIRL